MAGAIDSGAGESGTRVRSAAALLGAQGEQMAADYLAGESMTVLDRNWRCRDGELDLVALDGDEIVFVEVKTRTGNGYGMPAEAVTARKAQRIRRLATQWLGEHMDGWRNIRFDVIGIIVPGAGPATIEHYTGAF